MGRKPKEPKPQSGIPGLLWRQRGEKGGVWVVSLGVPKDMQQRVVNRNGKPLTRLERSLGTDSLSKAKHLYPAAMSGLKQELADRAGVALESPAETMKRAVANSYVGMTALTTTQESEAKNEAKLIIQNWQQSGVDLTDKSARKEAVKPLLVELSNSWLKAAEEKINDMGLPVTPELVNSVAKSLIHAASEASKTRAAESTAGLFAEPSEADQAIRKAAEKPVPVSISDVLKYKREEVSDKTFDNYITNLKNWRSIIKEESLDSITSTNLNYYARQLHKSKDNGGLGYTTDAANNETSKIRGLIKTFNQNIRIESDRRVLPDWEPIKKTVTEKKQEKIKEKAIRLEDAKRILSHARDVDIDTWKAILMLANTTFRVSEMLALKWGCIKELDGVVYFDNTDSKTIEGIRKHPLNSRLVKHLLPLRGDDDQFIVDNRITKTKQPKNALGQFLRDAKAKLNIEGPTNAHSFRHAAGGDLGYNCPEHIKKKLMGHAGGITDHYTREDMSKLNEVVEHLGFDL